jgi:hypothetical protein
MEVLQHEVDHVGQVVSTAAHSGASIALLCCRIMCIHNNYQGLQLHDGGSSWGSMGIELSVNRNPSLQFGFLFLKAFCSMYI